MSVNIEDYVASIPGFPKEGILFRDVTPILQHHEAFQEVTNRFAEYARKVKADVIVGPESRGFIFGAPTALVLGVGFVPVENRVNFREKPFLSNMIWNTAPVKSSCIKTRFSLVSVLSLLTICWLPAERLKQPLR